MNDNLKLFSEFDQVTAKIWKEAAIKDLKGADFDKKLVWKTDDGFPVHPFYTAEDMEGLCLPKNQHTISVGREWINYTEIKEDDVIKANALAVEMKKFGATGFLFKITHADKFDFNALLNGLDPAKDHISFSLAKPLPSFLQAYFTFLTAKDVKAEDINGFIEADILGTFSCEGSEPDFNALAEIVKITKPYPGFKGLTIRSHAFINAGSSSTQELAFTLNKITDYIEQLSAKGCEVKDVINGIMLHMAIGGDYFFEIAKLRAIRMLLKNIFSLYGCDASAIKILSSNSTWSKSFYDPNVNMLRNTTEAMSALLGGCDALLTLPHDSSYQEPSALSRRTALNISNILKGESYFDKVADPSAGSYYIEKLTNNLADHSLVLFKEIEEKGGFIKAFKAGIIQEKIKAVKDKKEKEIAFRRKVYVGTNKYPNHKEKTVLSSTHIKKENKDGHSLLVPQRATRSFEKLRNRTLANFEVTEFIPKVYLACFGNPAMRKARASFAREFFGIAGFEIMGEFFFDDVQQAAEESAASKADIVVICSSDQDYETQAAPFVQRFKSISKNKMLVLAGYPENIVEELKQAGLDTFIHIKSNAIEVLPDFQNKLLQNTSMMQLLKV